MMIIMMTIVVIKMLLKFKIVFDTGNVNHLKHIGLLHVSCE